MLTERPGQRCVGLSGRGSVGPHDSAALRGDPAPSLWVASTRTQDQPVQGRGLRYGGVRPLVSLFFGSETSRLCVADPRWHQALLVWPCGFMAWYADGSREHCSPSGKHRVCPHSCGQKCVPQPVAAWET